MKYILYVILYIYIPFAYGYGLSLFSELKDEIENEYQYNIKEYDKATWALLIILLIFPLIWPFVIAYNIYNCLRGK